MRQEDFDELVDKNKDKSLTNIKQDPELSSAQKQALLNERKEVDEEEQ